MRALLQRVSEASVTVEGETVGRIGPGLLVLLAVERGDTESEACWIAKKIAELRIFEDDQGKMNVSIVDTAGSVLLVPQFTLAADCRKGRRPSFDKATPPEEAIPMLGRVKTALEEGGLPVAEGRFGAHMKVSLVNDGPVTLLLERRP